MKDRKRNIKKVAMFWTGEILIVPVILVMVTSLFGDWLCLRISNMVILVLGAVLSFVTLLFAIRCSKSYVKSPSKGTLKLIAITNVLTILFVLEPLETITEFLCRPCLGQLLVYLSTNLWIYIIVAVICILGIIMCVFAYTEDDELWYHAKRNKRTTLLSEEWSFCFF